MEAHGYFSFAWSGSILYVRACGPFNDKGISIATKAYLKVIRNNNNSKISIIEILDQDSLSSLNSLEKLGKVWMKLSLNNCISLAFVHVTSIQNSLAIKSIPIFGSIFNTVADAEKWTKQKTEEHIALKRRIEFIEQRISLIQLVKTNIAKERSHI